MTIRSLVSVLVAMLLGLTSTAHAAPINLLTNPGFETGDFTGWTLTGNVPLGDVFVEKSVTPGHGTFQAGLGPTTLTGGLGFLAQTVATTAGAKYNLSYFLGNDTTGFIGGGPQFNQFQVSWDQVVVSDQSNFNDFSLRKFEVLDLPGSGFATTLAFGVLNSGFFRLDDVELTQVPEPTTLLLFGTTMAGLGLARWRRRKLN